MTVRHRYLNTMRPWPMAMRLCNPDGNVVPFSELSIKDNYMEDVAEIVSSMSERTFLIAKLGTFDVGPPNVKRAGVDSRV